MATYEDDTMTMLIQSTIDYVEEVFAPSRFESVRRDAVNGLTTAIERISIRFNYGLLTFSEACDDLSCIYDEADRVAERIDAELNATPMHSRSLTYDLYAAFAENLNNTLEWFQYEEMAPPDEAGELNAYYNRPYGNNVFGVVSLEDGCLIQTVVRPAFQHLNSETIRSVIDCKRDMMTMQQFVSPASPIFPQYTVDEMSKEYVPMVK